MSREVLFASHLSSRNSYISCSRLPFDHGDFRELTSCSAHALSHHVLWASKLRQSHWEIFLVFPGCSSLLSYCSSTLWCTRSRARPGWYHVGELMAKCSEILRAGGRTCKLKAEIWEYLQTEISKDTRVLFEFEFFSSPFSSETWNTSIGLILSFLSCHFSVQFSFYWTLSFFWRHKGMVTVRKVF